MKYALRSSEGMSLVELLSTILIMGFVAAGISQLAVTQNLIAFRTFNKIEVLTNARRVASIIERDVHNARFIGGSPPSFPAVINSPQTLVLQVPVFYDSMNNVTQGIPAIPAQATTGNWDVDTIVYNVVADQSNSGSGQFVLQKSIFLGQHAPGTINTQAITNQTILTGIVGPIDPSAVADVVAGTPQPKVFELMSTETPNGLGAAANGVAITLEVFSNSGSTRADLTPRSLAFRAEYFARGNYLAQ